MSYLSSGYEGLHGSVLMCLDCQRPTIHFTAPGGVAVCGFCGATPVESDDYDETDVNPSYPSYERGNRSSRNF